MRFHFRHRSASSVSEPPLHEGRGSVFRVFFSFAKLALTAVLLASVGIFGGRWFAARSEVGTLPETPRDSSGVALPDNTIVPGAVLGEGDTGSISVLSSENYRVGQIVLGGDVGILSQGDEFTDLSIADIRGETLGSKNQNEGRALITWKTSKAANSTLRFGKTAGQSEKSIEEDGFGMTHSAVLSSLDLASTYLYTISARDRYGNEITSDSHAVYTGSRIVSLFELIVNALQEVFGWAVKR